MYEPRIYAYVNEAAYNWRCEGGVDPDVLCLHHNLPVPYYPTPLIRLSPTLESYCQLGTVSLKDESGRFETPSFKVFGATWACHRTICNGLSLPTKTTCEELAAVLDKKPFRVTLHAATDGRWGQAVSCMADWLGVKARIYVPNSTPVELMREFFECAELVKVHGDFDAACEAARNAVWSLNEAAEENADLDIMPLLEAVGWEYGDTEHDNDEPYIRMGIDALTLAETAEARVRNKDDTPQVSIIEVEQADDGDTEDEGSAMKTEESVTVVRCPAGNTDDNNAKVLCPAETAESIFTPVDSHDVEPCVEQPISVRPMTPLSDIKRAHLLVQDGAFPGYEKFPSLVVEGYSTLMWEIDEDVHRLCQKGPGMIIVPVGTGSLAQAVVSYYKCIRRKTCPVIVAVEPSSAACLQASLRNGQRTKITTGETIMCGMNRGAVSTLAWPILRDGVDIAITVTDDEVEAAADMLEQHSDKLEYIGEHGPCSASTLAALCKLLPAKHPYRTGGDKEPKWVTKPYGLGLNSVVVLIGTESLYMR